MKRDMLSITADALLLKKRLTIACVVCHVILCVGSAALVLFLTANSILQPSLVAGLMNIYQKKMSLI